MKIPRAPALRVSLALLAVLGCTGCRAMHIHQIERRVDQLEARVANLEGRLAATSTK